MNRRRSRRLSVLNGGRIVIRKFALTTRCILATAATFVGIVSASAADIARQRAMPPAQPVYAPIYSWTGPYVGINGGGAWGRSNFSAPFATGNFNTSGGLI